MNRETILALNRINLDFYSRCAESFSSTRQRPWQGWQRVLEHAQSELSSGRPFSVLDLGCGNGRFARFLADRIETPMTYTGVDSSPSLLELARSQVGTDPSVRWVQADLVTDPDLTPLAGDEFSLVVAFGLLHHVPGFTQRRRLLAAAARRLRRGGQLVLSIWRFGAFERFRHRQLPWEEFNRGRRDPIDSSQLEAGDALLLWQTGPAYRFCHFIDQNEANALVSSLDLPCLDSFHADGQSGNLNLYYVLTRRATL